MAERRRTLREQASRAGDYLFGRNTLIGAASLMLLAISGYATWSGMSDFIVGVSSSANRGREIVGGLSVTNEALVIAIVITLTFLMWLALRETFGRERFWRERIVTFILYAFLALWSVGFGYGFWWSLIAGEEATRTSLTNLQEDARDAGAVISARLDAVKLQLDSVVSWSDSQMAREEASGGSCGIPSGAGRGPLYNARASVRDSVASLRDNIAQSWIAPVQADIKVLKDAASRLEGETVEDRQRLFETIAADIRAKARSIAARSNAVGQSTASEMRALSQTLARRPGQSGFSCYDQTLAQRLSEAAEQAGKPAVLSLREASFNEGPAGVANAVKNMWARIADVASFGLGDKASTTAEPVAFSGRDLIAFLATLGVDLGLFALTVLNPPRTPPNRSPLTPTEIGRMRQAIRTAILSAQEGDKAANLEWVRRHFIHHIGHYGLRAQYLPNDIHDRFDAKNTASFMVIPNLGAIPARTEGNAAPDGQAGTDNRREERRALAINQAAGVLNDAKLIRALSERELKYAEKESKSQGRTRKDATMGDNMGLIEKAHRTLEMAGWSPAASNDPEIFRVVDADGLLPLLTILREHGSTADDENAAAVTSGTAANDD